MADRRPVDVCVIGGSEAGLAACVGAAALGLSVTLVDDGDPSGLRNPDLVLDALREAAAHRPDAWPDLGSSLRRAAVERRHARLAAMNIRVTPTRASFADRDILLAGSVPVVARRFILAVGGRQPSATLVAPLGAARCMTIATLGACSSRPPAAAVLGGGPDAIAAAQALQRLGSRTVLIAERLLPGFDHELVAPLVTQLEQDGVGLRTGVGLQLCRPIPSGVQLTLSDGGTVEASHLLLAETPRPALDTLGLERAGIGVSGGQLILDRHGRTANRRVFAVGRAAGASSTAAGVQAVGPVLRAALLPLPTRARRPPTVSVVATDPEIATVTSPRFAAASAGAVRVWRWPLMHTGPGALTEAQGFVKVTTDRHGTLIAAGLVGPGAREMLGFWSLAVSRRLTLSQLAAVPVPLPSFAEAARSLALSQAAARLGRPIVGRALRLARWFD